MSDALKTELIRLGNANPELRKHLKPVIASVVKEAGAEDILSPGKASDHPDVRAFLAAIERMYARHFRGEFRAVAETKFGSNSIFIGFTLLPKSEWANGIQRNDPSYHQIWMHDSYSNSGLADRITVELSMGGSVRTPSRDRVKVGWRNGTGSPANVLKKFERYFAKLATVASANGYTLR
jgi:hypothetical protein